MLKSSSTDARHRQVDRRLDGPEDERADQQEHALAAEQRSRRVGERAAASRARARRRGGGAAPTAPTPASTQQDHAETGHQQRTVGRQHARAERAVHDHDEDRRQRHEVEYALGDDGAEDRPLARVAARGEQHDLERLAGARGQHVVAHVADARQRVAVAAARAHAGGGEDPVPALAAHDRRDRVQHGRSREPGDRVAAARELRRLLLRRPPHDCGERDQGDKGLDEREASVHGLTERLAPACDAVGGRRSCAGNNRPGAGRRAR